MKILHTLVSYLVGYLAIAALPFHLFAFASPLADSPLAADIEYYDGYVNITQSDSDSALMKRVPGDIIEERQAAVVVPGVLIIIGIVAFVALSVLWIEDDLPRRKKYTQDTVTATYKKYPAFNWVICHPSYSIGFDGVEGTDYGYTHHELKISFYRTIGYNLYWARSGTFTRHDDGGFANWAYIGNILGTDDGGATVRFGTT